MLLSSTMPSLSLVFFCASHFTRILYIYNKPKCCFSLIHKYIPLVDCICIIRIKFARYGTFFLLSLLSCMCIGFFAAFWRFMWKISHLFMKNTHTTNERRKKLCLYNCVWCRAEWVSHHPSDDEKKNPKLWISVWLSAMSMRIFVSRRLNGTRYTFMQSEKRSFASGSVSIIRSSHTVCVTVMAFLLDIQCVSCVYTVHK